MFAGAWKCLGLHRKGGLPQAKGAEGGEVEGGPLALAAAGVPATGNWRLPGDLAERAGACPEGVGWAGQKAGRASCPPREPLPLPYLKQEELPSIPSTEPPCPSFQYVLGAATSPAVKQQEEALTYLNQGTRGWRGGRGAWGRQAPPLPL